ncbi:MAG: glycosyltransferase family 2 protein [Acidobacteriaceae bacterium]|nr:glycosyltransferase family 2 protein [Acidobacteriaceae bacterium]
MNMNGNKPTVTVGIPVYNGDNYLAETLDSVLTQTFQDFEIVIADNGSTDGTQKICQDYAAKDPRIHHHRSEVNLGVTRNFKRTVGFSSGKYFMFLAHDDKLAPTFLEACVAALDAHPDVVLCYPKAIEIDTQGNALYKKEQFLDADSPHPHKRFRQMIRMDHNCETLFGLTRADVLKKTCIHAPLPDGDRIMLAEISLYGKYYRVPDYLFLHREHPVRTLNVYPTRFDRLPLYLEPHQYGKLILPHFAEFFEYLRCIRNAPLSFAERLACYGEMLRWVKDNRRRLWGDLLYVSKRFVKRLLRMQPRPSEAH